MKSGLQRLLAKHIQENCIKEGHPDLSKINQGTISKILNASKIKPHKIRYYIAKIDPDFDQKAADVLERVLKFILIRIKV